VRRCADRKPNLARSVVSELYGDVCGRIAGADNKDVAAAVWPSVAKVTRVNRSRQTRDLGSSFALAIGLARGISVTTGLIGDAGEYVAQLSPSADEQEHHGVVYGAITQIPRTPWLSRQRRAPRGAHSSSLTTAKPSLPGLLLVALQQWAEMESVHH
jgi:hypothetical protein